jgi:PleD family two-component response regulator
MNPINPEQIRILVADDDADIARGTAHLLEQAGYATAMAANGIEALQQLPTFRPHLVLSDRDMPELDGMELCRRIKGDPAFADVFVVLISATYTQSEEQVNGLKSGADSYIVRPIANRELTARVDAFVNIVRLHRALREKNAALEAALAKVKLLSGLVPICSGCKQIRDDKGYWIEVEHYIQKHSEAQFSHGLCPNCMKKYFPHLDLDETLATPP